jgi:hypothetical protein
MINVSLKLKKVRDEIVRFDQNIHAKLLARQKLQEEIRGIEEQVSRIRVLEQGMRLKKSLLGRLDIELARLKNQKIRLEREIPLMEREFKRMEQAGRFGKGF